MTGRIVLVEGDIATQAADVLVNAANSDLQLGSGVAGALRAAAGPALQQECDAIGSISVGAVARTSAGRLTARYVIHAAGMPPGGQASEESVRSCVRASFQLARELSCRTIAVPAIGTGVGGLSMQRCAELSMAEARAHLAEETSLDEIRFVLWGEPAFRIFEMVKDAAAIAAQMERLSRS